MKFLENFISSSMLYVSWFVREISIMMMKMM